MIPVEIITYQLDNNLYLVRRTRDINYYIVDNLFTYFI